MVLGVEQRVTIQLFLSLQVKNYLSALPTISRMGHICIINIS
jgi:hypothetical protein